jgi:hypothetical protein
MTPKHFALLAVAAVVSLAVAIATYSASKPWSLATQDGGKLFPALAGEAANVATIEIAQGADTLTIERTGQAWALKNRGGFPASVEKVRAFLLDLTEADLAEPKTRLPERYGLLDLGDPKAKGAASRLVRLLDDKGAVVAEVVVGKSRPDAFGSGKGGTYVRKPGDEQTWLVDSDISAGTALGDWIKAIAFETSTDKVSKITVAVEGQPSYVIERNADGDLKLADMPAGKKLKFVNVLDTIVESASYLPFEDVRKAEAAAQGNAGTVSLEGADGLKIEIKIRRDGDAPWFTVAATGDGASKSIAGEITARRSGWEFKMLPSKADGLSRKRDDLLEASSS